MTCKSLLLLIIIYTAISRFFLIDKIPPPLNPVIINLRILSAVASILTTGIIFFVVRTYIHNSKQALLSSWIFSILPWTFEQGRINSQANFALCLILFIFLLAQLNSTKLRYVLFLFIPAVLYLVYPQFWLFRLDVFKFTFASFLTNLSVLTSVDFLFFHNITFWWGGVRDFGVMYVALCPFFIVGIYNLMINKKVKLLLPLIGIATISALSPFFPESREFYLSLPLLSLVSASGIYHLSLESKTVSRFILICAMIFLTYEISQYYHFYFVHYPLQVIGNFSKFHEAF